MAGRPGRRGTDSLEGLLGAPDPKAAACLARCWGWGPGLIQPLSGVLEPLPQLPPWGKQWGPTVMELAAQVALFVPSWGHVLILFLAQFSRGQS